MGLFTFTHSPINHQNKLIIQINFEAETNTVKSRVGAYIKNEINYTRKSNLEGVNSHLLSINLEWQSCPIRLINIYRSFNPSDGRSANEMFNYQLNLIKFAYTPATMVVVNFNQN